MKPIRKMTTAPLPAPTPLPQKRASGPGKRKAVVVIVIVGALLAAGALLYSRTRTTTSTAKASDSRFCLLSSRFFAELAAVGVPPSGPVPASVGPEAISKALTAMGGVDELERAAPSKFQNDVRTVTGALKQAAAGDRSGVQAPGFLEAQRSITQLRPKECGPTSVDDGSALGRSDPPRHGTLG